MRWYPALGRSTPERNRLVRPEDFFQDLRRVLTEIEPTAAEQPLADLAEQLVAWSSVAADRQASLGQLAIKSNRKPFGVV